MDCQNFQDQLLDCFYGEANADTVNQVTEHRHNCHSCEETWTSWSFVRKAASQIPDVQPTPWLLSKIINLSIENHNKSNALNYYWDRFTGWIKNFGLAPGFVVTATLLATLIVLNAPPSSPLVASPGFNMGRNFVPGFEKSPISLVSAVDDNSIASPLALRERLLVNPFDALANAPVYEADADSLLMRGRRLKALGRIDLALQDFESIFRNFPQYSYMGDVLMYRAQCYAFQGNYDQAVQSLELFLKKDPSKKTLVQPMIEQIRDSNKVTIPDLVN